MHGWMQNPSCDARHLGNRHSPCREMDLTWSFLHYEWSHPCKVLALVALTTKIWCGLPASMWQNDIFTRGPINDIPMSNTNTYIRSRTIPSKKDSTVLVQRAWRKLWLVHIGRNRGTSSKSTNMRSGKSSCRHRRQFWFSKLPNSPAWEICSSSAGRIPQGIVAVRTFCITSRRGPGSSDDDSWIKLWSMDCQIGSARINLQESCTPIPWYHSSMFFLPNLGYIYQANEFWTSIGGEAASNGCQTHL